MFWQQESSKLEGRKSPQPHVNLRWNGDTIQPQVVLVFDDSYKQQQRDEPFGLNVEHEDDGPLSPIPH